MHTQKHTYREEHTKHSFGMWVIAAIAFGIGDTLTTMIGIHYFGFLELSPIVNEIIVSLGLGILPLLKWLVMMIFYALFVSVPRNIRIGIPIGLSLIGTVVMLWNTLLIVGKILG